MRGLRLNHLLALVIAGLILFSGGVAVEARSSWRPDNNRGGFNSSRSASTTERRGGLQEVASPGAVQKLRQALEHHRPSLNLISPNDGSVISDDTIQLTLQLTDWPLVDDPDIGIGPHVVVQIDQRAPIRLTQADQQGQLHLELSDLEPGSHRLSAWAAYPWGEPNPRPEASLQWRLHLWQQLRDRQPALDAPWLVTVHPPDDRALKVLPLNWLIWNAPLQNLRENDERWRLRISIDGDSFLVSHPEGLWVKAPSPSKELNVQMELLDGQGEPLDPVFNNQLIHLSASSERQPLWLKAQLSDADLSRYLGQAKPEPEPEPDAEANDLVVSPQQKELALEAPDQNNDEEESLTPLAEPSSSPSEARDDQTADNDLRNDSEQAADRSGLNEPKASEEIEAISIELQDDNDSAGGPLEKNTPLVESGG